MFPLFPESAELPFRSQQTGTGPNGALRHSQASPRLPAPLLLASSVLSSHPRSSTGCSVARSFSPHVRHTAPHDVVLPMPREPSSSAESLRVKLHSSSARLPTRGSDRAAGYDLYSPAASIIPARGKALVDTQISIAIPEGTYARVAPRSGLASKFSLHVGAGVIDPDYRGTIRILLFNLGDADFEIGVGDRIAQLVLERIANPVVAEVPELDSALDSYSPPTHEPVGSVSRFADVTATSKATPLDFGPSD